MARPKLKAEEQLNSMLDYIRNEQQLDAWTFRDIEKEYGHSNSVAAKTIIALALIAKGELDAGLHHLEEVLPHGDVSIARLFCNMYERFSRLETLEQYIFSLADKYATKWFTYKAASVAYLVGRISLCGEYMNRHIKMLSEEENRDIAEKFMQEALDDLHAAYEASGCSAEQFRQIGFAVSRVLSKFPFSGCRADINGNSGGCYTIQVIGAPPKQIAEMNMVLAEEICSIELLDECDLIARFSVERSVNMGANYAYN